jgi:hypothetical protein
MKTPRTRERSLRYLDKCEPDEPVFILTGRDSASPVTIKIWCHLWLQQIAMGLRPETDRPQITEAMRIATAMEIWHRDRHQKAEHAALEFDDRGVPLTGEHARKDNATTSGANDG